MIRQGKIDSSAVQGRTGRGCDETWSLTAIIRGGLTTGILPPRRMEFAGKTITTVGYGYCIPEEEAFRRLQKHLVKVWKDAEAKGSDISRMNFFIRSSSAVTWSSIMRLTRKTAGSSLRPRRISPLWYRAGEDSTTGNIFASYVIKNES